MAFFGWMAVVTFLSLFSFSNTDMSKIRIPYSDKAVHFVFYCTAAILGCLFVREHTRGRTGIKKTAGTMLFLLMVYGTIIEVLQSELTTTRDGNIYDALANTTGAIVGIWAINFLFSRKKQLKWKQ